MEFVREFGQGSLLFNMYHSKTNEKVKEKIRDDMSSDGLIRVLICTNAAGMGVNFKGSKMSFIMDCPVRWIALFSKWAELEEMESFHRN